MVFTVAMLVDRNNKNCLHKNKVLFPKDENFIVLTTNMGTVKTIYRIKLIVISKYIYIYMYVCVERGRERERERERERAKHQSHERLPFPNFR